MSRMAERAALIEDVENLLEDPRAGNTEDMKAILAALRTGKNRREILGMPEVIRDPNAWEYLDHALCGGFVICDGCRKAIPEADAIYFIKTRETFCLNCE